MTKTQIWVAAFLGLFLVLFSISYLTREENPTSSSDMSAPEGNEGQSENVAQADKELSAMTLIKNNGCTSCHGTDLKGTNLAPAIVNVKQNWSRDELISYLRNPSSFMDKNRFREYRKKYSSTIMPPFNHLDIKDLGKIADYLIKL